MQNKMIIWICWFIICFLPAVFPLKSYAGELPKIIYVEQVFNNNSSRDVSNVFVYDLTSLDGNNPMPPGTSDGIYSFTLAGTCTVKIPITFKEVGIYQYKINVNQSSSTTGYTYDPTVYKLTIMVKMTSSGLSEQMVIETSSTKSEQIKFVNTYKPLASDPKIMTDPPVQKTVSGSPPRPKTFSFTLTAEDPTAPMPEGSINGVKTITIAGSGTNEFGTWEYTREGIYCYNIAEVNFPNTGYIYDDSVYKITDVVEDIDGQLVVKRTVTNESNKQVSSFIFINKYKKTHSGGGGGNSVSTVAQTLVSSIANEEASVEIEDTNAPSLYLGDADESGVPKVGDEVRIELYITILCLGVICMFSCIIYQLHAGGRRKVKWFLLFASVCLMMFSCNKLREGLQVYKEGNQSYELLRQQTRHKQDGKSTDYNVEYETQEKSLVDTISDSIDFEALKRINPDAAAWLYSPDTAIDYPVMRADDYDWYLNHLPDGTYNANGTLFLDYNCPADFSGRLSIIYGHHMKSGKMFGSLKGYKGQEYFEQHPSLYLYTEQKDYRIDLVYGCVISAGQWRDRAFMYELNLESLLKYASTKTTFKSSVEYTEEDKFIVLATCSYEFDDARYIVIGVLRPEN